MKTAFTAAILTILAVTPTVYADHDSDRGGSPERLAIALANQSREIVQEFQHHFPHKRGLNQRAFIILRLAESTRHDVLHRHDLHSTIRQVAKLEDLLDDLEDHLDDKLDDRRYRHGRHVLGTVKEAEGLAKLLRRSLQDVDRHVHRAPLRPVYHDHRERISDHPGFITFNRGGFSFGIRLR